MRALALLAAAACSSAAPATSTTTSTGADEPALAETYETRLRPPALPFEHALAEEDVLFDPALDCVARALAARAPARPDPLRFRHQLSMRCGSPLYVLRAELVTGDTAAIDAVHALATAYPSNAALVLGVAAAGPSDDRSIDKPELARVGETSGRGFPSRGASRVVVMARRVIEIEPVPRTGAARIRGRVLVPATAGKLFVSTSRGVKSVPVTYKDGAFAIETPLGADVDLELTMTNDTTTEPLGRMQLGAGSSLFRRDGSLMTRINAARRVVGGLPLERREQPGTCDEIPPQVGGIDVTDRARCFRIPMMDFAGLPDELAHRPQLQDILMTNTAALIELGETSAGWVMVRLLFRFEALGPEALRARVLEILRQRWPQLQERKVSGTQLEGVLAAWRADKEPYGSSATYKPQLDQVAAKWTTTKTYYSGLTTARDLEQAMALIAPDATPTAVDLAAAQARRADGSMIHLVAIVLELP